ncbi:MAG: YHS domain-containing protein [Actinobacteria bacterium]|nr:YHS domain-containing protein [Actinomycetota bacterium]
MAKCIACAANGFDIDVDEKQAQQDHMTVEYQGRTYYFESAEHMNMFKEDPDRYIQMAREKGFAA